MFGAAFCLRQKDLSRLLNSFRVRLLLLLAALLMLTLSVQYYVNLRSVRSNTNFIIEQQQAIMAGVSRWSEQSFQRAVSGSDAVSRHSSHYSATRLTG